MVTVKMLVRSGARVDSTNNIGGTPLSYAVCSGNQNLVKLMLKGSSQAKLEDEIQMRQNLLLKTISSKQEAVVKLLLDTSKVDVNTMQLVQHR